MTRLPANRGLRRRTTTRLKRALRHPHERGSSVVISDDVVVKTYPARSAAMTAYERLSLISDQLIGLASTPRVLEVHDRSIVTERLHGVTLWEMCRSSTTSAEERTSLDAMIRRSGRVLGRIHSAPSQNSAGLVSPAFAHEVTWAFDSEDQDEPQLALVPSHCDFAPINLLVTTDHELVVLDPEPNSYVTALPGELSPYVDLGIWFSGLTSRLPSRHHPAHRRRVLSAVDASLSAYRMESGINVQRWAVFAYSCAVTSAYLRTLRVPTRFSRKITAHLSRPFRVEGSSHGRRST